MRERTRIAPWAEVVAPCPVFFTSYEIAASAPLAPPCAFVSAPTAHPSSASSSASRTTNRQAAFAPTQWSVVLHAGRNDTPRAQEALARLCQTYWYPLYAHVRRRGHRAHDAQDLTQAFFAQLLARQTLGRADPARGRFRTFILTALDRFLADEWDKSRAQKRGGATELLSLDLAAAERRFDLEPADTAAPDQAFDRQWALALLETVLDRLEDEYRRDGKAGWFAMLRPTLTGARELQPYAELAVRLGSNEGAVKVAVHRLRKLYRALLQAEILETVASPEEASEEMRHLLRVLAGG
jgi:RNA polymerase sigma factor (sigma-70 family)